jgi:methylated-DNA-protein-cysteine methyltransferase related protein
VTSDSHRRILEVVRSIPRGRVATYGQVAELAGLPRQPRLVGYALASLGASTSVPWHRVVGARGLISLRGDAGVVQRLRLAAEGVEVNDVGKLDLVRYRWAPGAAPTAHRRTVSPRTADRR